MLPRHTPKLRNYAPTYPDIPNVYNLHELSSDEYHRAGSRRELVRWRTVGKELWKHKWTPYHGSFRYGWAFVFAGVGSINRIIDHLQGSLISTKVIPGQLAEMRTLRAFYYYQALDLFGNVPIVERIRRRCTRRCHPKSRRGIRLCEKELVANVCRY